MKMFGDFAFLPTKCDLCNNHIWLERFRPFDEYGWNETYDTYNDIFLADLKYGIACKECANKVGKLSHNELFHYAKNGAINVAEWNI